MKKIFGMSLLAFAFLFMGAKDENKGCFSKDDLKAAFSEEKKTELVNKYKNKDLSKASDDEVKDLEEELTSQAESIDKDELCNFISLRMLKHENGSKEMCEKAKDECLKKDWKPSKEMIKKEIKNIINMEKYIQYKDLAFEVMKDAKEFDCSSDKEEIEKSLGEKMKRINSLMKKAMKTVGAQMVKSHGKEGSEEGSEEGRSAPVKDGKKGSKRTEAGNDALAAE